MDGEKGSQSMNEKSFFTVYHSGEVRRFHTMRVVYPISIGEHSWGVALILLWLYTPSSPSAALLHAAILHDVPESATGDIPGHVKWNYPDLAEALAEIERVFHVAHGTETGLSQSETAVLRFADLAELVCYSLTEMQMGNRRMKIIVERSLEKLHAIVDVAIDVGDPLPARAKTLLADLKAELNSLKL